MKIFGRKNNKFNKWFLKTFPYALIDNKGNILTTARDYEVATKYQLCLMGYKLGLDTVLYKNP